MFPEKLLAEGKMICGILDYKDEKYIYRFQNNILCMENIEHLGKQYMIPEWLDSPPSFSGEHLRGINQENGNIVLFKTYPGSAGFKNTQIHVKVQYYVELQKEEDIGKITIKGDEIDYIYDISKGIESYDFGREGTASCKTKSFDETTSLTEYFYCEERRIGVYFTIYRGIQFGTSIPLHLHSCINLEIENTKDYDFIVHIYRVVRKWLCFMCYRENVSISEVALFKECDEAKYKKIGRIVFNDNYLEKENEKILKNRNITYTSVQSKVGTMLQDIVDEKLYLRHLPESHKDSLKINHSKFIMVTAAVEWLLKNLYPDGIKHSEKKKKAIAQVRSELEERIANTSGEVKAQYKFLNKILGSDSLSQKIEKLGEDYNALFEPIGKYLYGINDCIEEFNYAKIGARIQLQRNNFAHGNLDQESEEIAILDLIYLEKIIYILQLSRYEIDNNTIINQIKRLFGMNF